MKLTIYIDEIPHQIDTADPELLAKWIVEIFGRMRDWNPATYVRIQAQPSWLPNDKAPGGYSTDWTADSRIICQTARIRQPRDLLTELSNQLDQAEAFQ